ncbi:type III restriction protein res subunit [Desulfurobacterium thermolithotrophum DSM 11699]|uniref:Type III restriction protein res subunit n=1 Tax=Desulfurobacterium thermolithotrophum (strain DSM 11699 / BSA) TaxID=868864 RepID=F0S322_DESTD|nr:DEAD/DEAH box helicase family protein [Desulfurobacterium thermolithotrophum]ADY73244.1 type III restriction protein res subunit [Desulfurobacterium thermolithotrophum DSM 11699]
MATKLKAQPYIKLQQIAEEIEIKNPNWDILDNTFSTQKTLFDYQQQALENALKILWKYFEDLQENKEEFAKIYKDLDIYEDLHIKLKGNKHAELLKEFFNVEIDNKGNEYIPFSEISNRMSFWMATGSGKTLIIVKLITLLHKLMKLGLIPKKEIMFLTYRQDLLKAFKKHVEEYNQGKSLENQIKLISLKDYEKEKNQKDFSNRVFIYRSDLISDERKENILNFRDYLENQNEKLIGNWYLILDEAHKGDSQESKRQNIFSILTQKGFLFNFSATFTEAIDIVSTVYNLNLNEFINKGYGKQIYVSNEEINAFKEKSDFNEKAKRKIILKNLINLTAVKKAYEKIKDENLYHNPLLIFLMNSVNTKDADLKLVFKELAKIGKNIDQNLFNEAKNELIEEFKNAKYTLGEGSYTLDFINEFVEKIDKNHIYQYVYNSSTGGNIEYIINPNQKQEIALKLDTSDKPFALIKIGDISKWIKENLTEYKENESYEEKGYFENLNNPDSPINILLGSRAFYEGWDSNRPNIITFINIGTGTDAKKFVLQAIGRGIRIEPLPNQRKRLDRLAVNNQSLNQKLEEYKKEIKTLETLLVYATNKKAIETILKELELVKKSEGFEEVSLWKNERIKKENLLLLIPSYAKNKEKIINQAYPVKFRMSKENLDILKIYFQLMPVERFILEYETDIETYNSLKKIVEESNKYIAIDKNRNYKDIKMLINSLINHINAETEDFNEFIPVNDKIVHFRKIKVRNDYKDKFVKAVEKVKDSDVNKANIIKETLKGQGIEGNIIENTIKSLLQQEIDDVKIRKLLQHYYIPIIYTKEKKDWIKHIINIESEYDFIANLLEIIDDIDKHYDWWMFSKLDEHLDKEIYIPYVNQGKTKKFIPDFVFWLKKGNDYKILFIDPKGSVYSSYLEKIDGYKSIFEENGKPKTFRINKGNSNLNVKVDLKLYTKDTVSAIAGTEYKKYWIDKKSMKNVFITSSKSLNSQSTK